MIKKILDVLEAERIYFRHYSRDNLIEIDSPGSDTGFLKTINVINMHLEDWVYNDEMGLEITIDCAFERVQIHY